MLKKILLIPSLLLVNHFAQAQTSDYQAVMKTAVSVVDTCETKSNFLLMSEKFGHFASVKKNDWLPYYYLAFCYTHLSMMYKSVDSIIDYTDRADRALSIADSISPKNSEIYCLKSLNTIAKINVDYVNRGLDYSASANKLLDQAEQYNAVNPRVFYLRGRYLYSRPEQFGGGKAPALPFFKRAAELYATDGNKDTLNPHWGSRLADRLLNQCIAYSK